MPNINAIQYQNQKEEESVDRITIDETRMSQTMEMDKEKEGKSTNNNSPAMMRGSGAKHDGKHSRLRWGQDKQLPEESSDAFADRLSSSLASIKYSPTHATNISFDASKFPGPKPPPKQTENASDGGEGSAESSTGSSNNGGSSDARQVTASTTTTNTTSSGEERDSLFRTQNASRSSSEERDFSRKEGKRPSEQAKEDNRARFLHHAYHVHHHPHGGLHSHSSKPKYESKVSSVADDFGLPVPIDDRVPGESSGNRHAAVVAHLPPPSADSFSSSGSGGEGERATDERKDSLLEPYREPGYHTIRLTFNRLSRRDKAAKDLPETDSSGDNKEPSKHKKSAAKRPLPGPTEGGKKKKKRVEHASDSSSDDNACTNGSSSGSGTEGGYAGSASSNDNAARGVGSYSSPSVSSSEESMAKRKRAKSGGASNVPPDPNRPLISSKKHETSSVSSEIADFSSGASETEVAKTMKELREESSSITSSSNEDSDEQDLSDMAINKSQRRTSESPPRSLQLPTGERLPAKDTKPRARLKIDDSSSNELSLEGKPPLLAVGPDVIAHVLTFLEPPEILDVLTAPLSKDWLDTFCKQQELWRVLCIVEPFKAQVGEVNDTQSDESIDSFPMNVEAELRLRFGKFRMMYTSFVRCMRYLGRIKDDAMNGRAPSVIDYGAADATASRSIGGNQNLQAFLARARGFVIRNRTDTEQAAADSLTDSSSSDEDNNNNEGEGVARMARADPIGVSDDGSSSSHAPKRKRRRKQAKGPSSRREVRYASSSITRRLLLPAASGEPSHTDLPWSCAIYSIVNWMVAFSNVEGIQTMCLKVLPFILEDEQQRMTAQRAGLTDVVLRGMVMFPDSVPLHTAAFHTIVLLARPLGGREGMLFHSSMVNASGIFSGGNAGGTNGKSGIAVMLDSMKRFESEEVLQAMSCWSLVNIALAPAQKEVLVKLGGIQATAGAMVAHPENAEVQFRALFALINLVIPSVAINNNVDTQEDTAIEDEPANDMLDELVEQIVGLVVRAMKNYCSSEAILNRACLVLHNLSLTPAYHQQLLMVPHCYQMLEWCLANYRTDQVLQQSATGTLHRLQATLSSNDSLRARFTTALQAQHRMSLQQAHHEALALRQLESQLANEDPPP